VAGDRHDVNGAAEGDRPGAQARAPGGGLALRDARTGEPTAHDRGVLGRLGATG
jgi:hypothetical protein